MVIVVPKGARGAFAEPFSHYTDSMRFDHEGEIPYFHKLNKFYFPRKAFLGRKEKGLGLSDRVWRYTYEFKNEIELGLDVGIRNGSDAAKMARELNTFLQNPDKLFRRVRDEHGMLKLSKAAKGFHPGQGVYRSSYKNARRLAATETNMAYRTADYERWQQMDFVVGIEIHLSNNHTCLGRDGKPHPFTDICDELQGRYPKDFKFTGWHPHCRCYATTIFKTDEEFKADEERMLRGEEPTAPEDSENAVNDMPKQFNDWLEEHREQIELSRLRGNEPYFLRDNTEQVNTALGISQSQPAYIQPTLFDTTKPEPPKATPAEARAKVIDELRKRGSLPKEAIDKLEQITDPEEFNRRANSLQAVAERHEKRTEQQIAEIRERLSEREKKHTLIIKTANNILKVAKDYGEIDFAELEAAINAGDLTKMQTVTKTVARNISEVRKQEKALADFIPDAHDLHKQFTMQELQETATDIEYRFNTLWSKKYGYKDWEHAGVEHLKGKIEWELSNESSKYKHFQLAERVLRKKLAEVEDRIYFDGLNDKLNEMQLYFGQHKKATKLESSIDALKAAMATKDKAATQKAIADFEAHKTKLEANAAKRKAAKAPAINIEDSKPKEVALVTETAKQAGHQGSGAYFEYDASGATDVALSHTNVLKQTLLKFGATEEGKVFGKDLRTLSSQKTVNDLKTALSTMDVQYSTNKTELARLKAVVADIIEECKMQARAVGNYSFEWDYEIRHIQCGEKVTSKHRHTKKDMKERAETVERFIRCSPRWDGGVTYRGMSLSQKDLDHLITQCKAGVGDMLGSASWSTKEGTAQKFSRYHLNEKSQTFGDTIDKQVVLVTDTHKLATSITHLSKFRDREGEVLGSMTERFTFIRQETKGSVIYIYVRPT